MIEAEPLKPKKDPLARASMALIWLCWFNYSCAYVGKLSYAASINQIIGEFGVTHSEAGLVSTFLFFAYGAGQFVNGLLCKKYNIKWTVFFSITVSGLINLVVALTPSFEIIKYLWLINGFLLSMLWPCQIRLLTETLSKKYMARTGIIMGSTVAVGTVAVYLMSALFTKVNMFRLTFVMSAILLPASALLWLLTVSKIVKKISFASPLEEDEEETVAPVGVVQDTTTMSKRALRLSIVMLALFAFFGNLIKDGLTTWVPSILLEQYDLGAAFSIVLSLALPFVTLLSNPFAIAFHKKLSDFVLQCAAVFLMSGTIIGIVIGSLSFGQVIITLICFALVCFLLASSHSVITSHFPLFMKGKINSGMLAGVLNGFAYLGSTVSSYGLGLVRELAGWDAVFWLLLAICGAMCVIAVAYVLIKGRMSKK